MATNPTNLRDLLTPPASPSQASAVPGQLPVSMGDLLMSVLRGIGGETLKQVQQPSFPPPPPPGATRAELLAHLRSPEYQEASNSRLMGFAGMSGLLNMRPGAVNRPFFSALKEYAETKLPASIEGAQAKATLRKIATADEWSTSGLEGKLQPGQKYGKADILAHIDDNVPRLEDVVLSDLTPAQLDRPVGPDTPPINKVRRTQFSGYQEPGGTNYKELFVTAPRPRLPGFEGKEFSVVDPKAADAPQWFDGHDAYSDIENPIVRLRFNDRVSTDGKKVLFLEEMQPPNPSNQEKMPPELLKRWREIGMKRAVKYAADNGYDRVAWTTGKMQSDRYDLSQAVSELSYLPVGPAPAGNYAVYYVPKAQPQYHGRPNQVYLGHFPADQLESEVGKDLAEKIIKGEGQAMPNSTKKVFTGLDLSIGGKGLQRVYDSDLPIAAKSLGAEVGTTTLKIPGKTPPTAPYTLQAVPGDYTRYRVVHERPGGNGMIVGEFPSHEQALQRVQELNLPFTPRTQVPSIDITPLREKASFGFPIYGSGPRLKDLLTPPNLPKGVNYIGKQEGFGDTPGFDLYNWTPPGSKTEATFAVKPGETVAGQLAESKAKFAPKSAPKSTLDLKKLGTEVAPESFTSGWITPEGKLIDIGKSEHPKSLSNAGAVLTRQTNWQQVAENAGYIRATSEISQRMGGVPSRRHAFQIFGHPTDEQIGAMRAVESQTENPALFELTHPQGITGSFAGGSGEGVNQIRRTIQDLNFRPDKKTSELSPNPRQLPAQPYPYTPSLMDFLQPPQSGLGVSYNA